MPDDLLHAIECVKSGKKSEGGRILASIIKVNPDDEAAWIWLSACVVPEAQKRHCLDQVLRINPQNEYAKNTLAALDFQPIFDETGKQESSSDSETPWYRDKIIYIFTFLFMGPVWAILILSDKKQSSSVKIFAGIILTLIMIYCVLIVPLMYTWYSL
jgi:hypothetical protein